MFLFDVSMNFLGSRFYVGEVPASDVVVKFGTPVFVYDEDVALVGFHPIVGGHLAVPVAVYGYALFPRAFPEPSFPGPHEWPDCIRTIDNVESYQDFLYGLRLLVIQFV